MKLKAENALNRIYTPVIRRILELELSCRKFKKQYPRLYDFAQLQRTQGIKALTIFFENEGKTEPKSLIADLKLIDTYLNYIQLPFPAINISRLRLSNHGIDVKNFINFLEASRLDFQNLLYSHFPQENSDELTEILTLHSLADITSSNDLDSLILNCSLLQKYIENYQEAFTVKNYLYCKDILDFLFNCKTPSHSSTIGSFIESQFFTINKNAQHYVSLNLKCLEQSENIPNLLIDFMLSYMNESLAFLNQVRADTPDDMIDYYKNGLKKADEIIRALDSINNLRSEFDTYPSFVPALIALKCWDNRQSLEATNVKIAKITLEQIKELFGKHMAQVDPLNPEHEKRKLFIKNNLESFTLDNIRTHFGKFQKIHFANVTSHAYF